MSSLTQRFPAGARLAVHAVLSLGSALTRRPRLIGTSDWSTPARSLTCAPPSAACANGHRGFSKAVASGFGFTPRTPAISSKDCRMDLTEYATNLRSRYGIAQPFFEGDDV